MTPAIVKNTTTIIWDWNGTLLNDMSHSINCMNRLLEPRGLLKLCADRYQQVFTFPVRNYYETLGFDFQKEEFEIPAEEFIVHYNIGLQHIPLYEDAMTILKALSDAGFRQYMASAMQHNALIRSVTERNILHFFRKVYGIADNLAHGKSNLVKQLIADEHIVPAQTLLIGDTLHDAEVAAENGIYNVLIARGHQSRLRLESSGNPIFESLTDFYNRFNELKQLVDNHPET
jgi:phosphoglycolate phosphatase